VIDLTRITCIMPMSGCSIGMATATPHGQYARAAAGSHQPPPLGRRSASPTGGAPRLIHPLWRTLQRQM
jgi:hypothetical protein